MLLFVGFNSRTSIFFSQRAWLQKIAVVPAVILGIFGAATQWCSPDGVPPQPIDSFVASLSDLANQHAGKVRILHFGDSHIASDSETAIVRSSLQRRFGDGGPGLVLPWKGPRLYTVNYTYGNTYGWQRVHPAYNTATDDTGLGLTYLEARAPGQTVWIEASASTIRVDYLAQPGGGAAAFLLDGAPLGQRAMSADSPRLQTARFQASGPDAPHRFEIHTLDSRPVRILGVSVERSSPGVVYSALGLVGARAEFLLKCREETFAAEIAAEQPNLVILGYGTNESSGTSLDENAYATALSNIISRVRRAAPSALLVLLTPPDRGDSNPAQAQRIQRVLQQVISVERTVAWNEGAILLDLHTAMGGAGSAAHWAGAQPPLARPDLTHFTNEGYNLLGRYIAGGIMKLYDGGPEEQQAGLAASGSRPNEFTPSLYSASSSVLSASNRTGFSDATRSSEISYFLRNDGQIIVTNDLATLDTGKGHVISAAQAGCWLRRKAAPCNNTAPW